MKLRQVASGWEFESEKYLEDLVWNNQDLRNWHIGRVRQISTIWLFT
ncbi:hypothetical protein H6F32_08490 [Anabaena sp. FACHB-1237]|nr:hypothetical protein [Anabaena sp. FACHB-1237]MBD2137621.1 hypothetical protein [Anabaena sp. FACHB-1237]